MKKLILYMSILLLPIVGIAQQPSKTLLSKDLLIGKWEYIDEYTEERGFPSMIYTFKADGTGTRYTPESSFGSNIIPAEIVGLKWCVSGNSLIVYIEGRKMEYDNLQKENNNLLTRTYYSMFEDYNYKETFRRII